MAIESIVSNLSPHHPIPSSHNSLADMTQGNLTNSSIYLAEVLLSVTTAATTTIAGQENSVASILSKVQRLPSDKHTGQVPTMLQQNLSAAAPSGDFLSNTTGYDDVAVSETEPFRMDYRADVIWTVVFSIMITSAILGNLVVFWIVLGKCGLILTEC